MLSAVIPSVHSYPAQAHGARDAGTRHRADRTVLLRGPPGSPGPSIARGRATTSGLGGTRTSIRHAARSPSVAVLTPARSAVSPPPRGGTLPERASPPGG